MPPRRKFVPIKLSEEDRLQKAIVDHWRQRGARDTVVAAIPNGGQRSFTTAARMKITGALAGMPDLLCVAGGQTFFIELKARRGRLSNCQGEVIPMLRAAGVEVFVSKDLDEVIALLEARGVLRPAAMAA